MLKGFSVQQVLGASGPANSILFLNGSQVPTGSSSLTFDGTNMGIGGVTPQGRLHLGGDSPYLYIQDTVNPASNVGIYLGAPGASQYAGLLTNFASDQLLIRHNGATRAIIDQGGSFLANTGAVDTSASRGFLYVAGCAGAPTGTPASYAGLAPIVVDTTNNKLYFYSGGSWRDAGP